MHHTELASRSLDLVPVGQALSGINESYLDKTATGMMLALTWNGDYDFKPWISSITENEKPKYDCLWAGKPAVSGP